MNSPIKTKLTGYDLGKTSIYAFKNDQRFSYCAYVPTSYKPDQKNDHNLIVVIHGSDRNNQTLRDHFAAFAEENNCIILSPLFPCGIEDFDDKDNYKYIAYNELRFDDLLLGLIDDMSLKYKIKWPKFSLFGFSGGAHFAHRFLLLHPERLHSIAIASPGSVTLINDQKNWWVGTADLEQKFGKKINLPHLKSVKIHLSIGLDDLNTNGITHALGSAHWMEGANDAGTDRVEKLHSLYDNYKSLGLNVSLTTLPKTAHDCNAMSDCAIDFFKKSL